MIPAISSSVNGAVLKIRKIVPRLDFSSRAISARSFPAAYSSMTRMWVPLNGATVYQGIVAVRGRPLR